MAAKTNTHRRNEADENEIINRKTSPFPMLTVTPFKYSWAKGDRLNPVVNETFRTTARVLISTC